MQNPPICDYEGSDYQQRFWQEGRRSYEDAVEAVALRRLLPPQGGQHLLELGAGAGRNTPRYHNYKYVTLVDYSRTQLEQARQALGDSGRFTYVQADAYHLPFFAGVFDAATMIRTLHHMADAPQTLQSVRRVMAEDSQFLLEFANKRNLKSIFRWLLKKQSWSPFSPEQVEFVELNYNFHPKTIIDTLQKSGFENKKNLGVSIFRSNWFKNHIEHERLVKWDARFQNKEPFKGLTPSIFTLNRTTSPSEQPVQGSFFSCPICSHPLPEEKATQVCPGCSHEWQYSQGIYEFRINPEQ